MFTGFSGILSISFLKGLCYNSFYFEAAAWIWLDNRPCSAVPVCGKLFLQPAADGIFTHSHRNPKSARKGSITHYIIRMGGDHMGHLKIYKDNYVGYAKRQVGIQHPDEVQINFDLRIVSIPHIFVDENVGYGCGVRIVVFVNF